MPCAGDTGGRTDEDDALLVLGGAAHAAHELVEQGVVGDVLELGCGGHGAGAGQGARGDAEKVTGDAGTLATLSRRQSSARGRLAGLQRSHAWVFLARPPGPPSPAPMCTRHPRRPSSAPPFWDVRSVGRAGPATEADEGTTRALEARASEKLS